MRMRQQGRLYRNQSDKALCHGSTQLDRGTGSGSQLSRPTGRSGLINGSCFGPNTQLDDLTKCSVSSPPLFFSGSAQCLSSSYRRRSGTRWGKWLGPRSARLFSALWLSIKGNEMRLCQEWICYCTTVGLIIRVFGHDDILLADLIIGKWGCREFSL